MRKMKTSKNQKTKYVDDMEDIKEQELSILSELEEYNYYNEAEYKKSLKNYINQGAVFFPIAFLISVTLFGFIMVLSYQGSVYALENGHASALIVYFVVEVISISLTLMYGIILKDSFNEYREYKKKKERVKIK